MASEIKVNKITGKGATGGADAPLQFNGNTLTATIANVTIATGTATLSKLNLSSTTPPSPVEGDMYFDSTNKLLKIYVNSEWQSVYGVGNFTNPGLGSYAVDNYTKLLIHSDTTNTSTTFTDSSRLNTHTITATGNVQHKTAQQQFGATSMYFDGTGDYLSLADHSDWTLGTTFTIDMWLRMDSSPTNTGQQTIWAQQVSGTDRFVWWINGTTQQVQLKINDNDQFGGINVGLSFDTWHHVALVFDGTNARFFTDGVQKSSSTIVVSGGVPDISAGVNIGYQVSSGPFQGYLDEIRVSKGIARWTSNFTV